MSIHSQTNDDLAKLLLRSSFGIILIAHALLKIFVFTIPGTVGFFQSLGLPALLAYLTILGELSLGAFLIIGLATRLSALLSAPIMAGALWVHSSNGWLFSNQGGGWEFPALLVALSVTVFLQGAGKFSVDAKLRGATGPIAKLAH